MRNSKGQFVKGFKFSKEILEKRRKTRIGHPATNTKPNSGSFKKGSIPWNEGKKWDKETRDKIGKGNKGKKLSEETKEKMKGRIPWNRGVKKATNTGKTWFKKGQIPQNYKGGITKTRAYHNFYNRRRQNRKKNIVGSHTFEEWENLKKEFNYTCLCCKRKEPEIKLTQDHIIPVSKKGSDYIENIQPLCGNCNSKKHTKIINYKLDLCHLSIMELTVV